PVSQFLAGGKNRRQEKPTLEPMLFPIMLAIMAALTLATALIGRYPFGGPLRHQFFMFPFAILSLVAVLDRIVRRLDSAWQRPALVALVMAGLAGRSGQWVGQLSVPPGR